MPVTMIQIQIRSPGLESSNTTVRTSQVCKVTEKNTVNFQHVYTIWFVPEYVPLESLQYQWFWIPVGWFTLSWWRYSPWQWGWTVPTDQSCRLTLCQSHPLEGPCQPLEFSILPRSEFSHTLIQQGSQETQLLAKINVAIKLQTVWRWEVTLYTCLQTETQLQFRHTAVLFITVEVYHLFVSPNKNNWLHSAQLVLHHRNCYRSSRW